MLFNIFVALIMLFFAAKSDLERGKVNGMVLYPAIFIGMIVSLLNIGALSGQGLFTYVNFLIAVSVVVVGIVLRELKVLWGADILLFTGLILLTPIQMMTLPYYLGLFGFSALCGTAYYLLLSLLRKKKKKTFKFVPAIAVAYIVVVFGLFYPLVIPRLIQLIWVLFV